MNNKPQLFQRSDIFMFLGIGVINLYINSSKNIPLEGFSSTLGICTSLAIGLLIGVFFRQGWTFRQSIPGIPSFRLMQARHSWQHLFSKEALFPYTEFLLETAVIAGIFIADKVTTGSCHNSILINFILCLGIFANLLRRQYWKR
jgi:hypothetical protein